MALVVYEESILTKIHQRQHIFNFHGRIEKEVIINQEGRGTGGILWPASELLSHFLNEESDFHLENYLPQNEENNRWIWENKMVLELGSGLGLTSILLSSLGAKVIATDGEETVVNQLSKNFDLNINEFKRENCKSCLYRWGDDFQSIFDCLNQPPGWTSSSSSSSSSNLFDIILAADVVYGEDVRVWSLLEQSIQTGIELSRQGLSPSSSSSSSSPPPHHQPIILIAQTERYPEKEAFFFRRLMKKLTLRDTFDISGRATSAATSVNGESTSSKCTLYVFTPTPS